MVDFWQTLPPLVTWLLSAVVLAILVGYTTNFIYDRVAKRGKVKILTPRDKRAVNGFVDLYSAVIEERDQIAPELFLRFLKDRNFSPRSVHALRRNMRRGLRINRHILLVAERQRQCTGFLKVIVPERGDYVFISYLGVSAHGVSAALSTSSGTSWTGLFPRYGSLSMR
ncbi:hypothetical protein BJF78_15865 [Pseudonocardia sp. CNS-139]|nr:hypothetical protein BJF78_15865 [Pseudonocardia sp. CNS-139]